MNSIVGKLVPLEKWILLKFEALAKYKGGSRFRFYVRSVKNRSNGDFEY